MIEFTEFNEKFKTACFREYEKYIKFADKFYILTQMLIETNKKMNLTAITDVDEIILKHYIDCLTAEKYIPENTSLIDVGCGGGFPTLPLSIVRDDIIITALDSTAKKLGFVKSVAEKLNLNIKTLPARAEDIGRKPEYREKYGVVTARAVSSLNILSELCLPLTAVGGRFIAMKGSSGHDEFISAKNAIKILGGEPGEVSLMLGGMMRFIYITDKKRKTPTQYPRQYAGITKSPL